MINSSLRHSIFVRKKLDEMVANACIRVLSAESRSDKDCFILSNTDTLQTYFYS